MKAIVCHRDGPLDQLEFTETPIPTPADDEVLVKIHAASVNPLDSYTIRGLSAIIPVLARFSKPRTRIPGADIAGRVEAVGSSVTGLHLGDEVFGALFSGRGFGGFAEYACAEENKLALTPGNLTFEEAAAIPIAGLTALQGLRDKGEIKPGQSVLIDGASGGVGTFAVQIAKALGAVVTATCSTRNVDQTRLLGADRVIDYTREDFARSGERYDLIIGANAHHSVFAYRRALKPNGIFVMVGGALSSIFQALLLNPLLSRMGTKKMRFFIAKIATADLTVLKDLIEAGKVKPVIDRTYPLSQTAEALAYRDQGHARGKVVIAVDDDSCRQKDLHKALESFPVGL
jgi:NADPH:quinone reductase-like Zn-dependent oxidoreductase